MATAFSEQHGLSATPKRAMTWIIDRLLMEWSVVQQTPILFSAAVILVAALVFLLVRWMFAERLAAAMALNGLYRDRYGAMNSIASSPLGQLRNSALQTKAMALAARMRNIATECERSSISAALGEAVEQRNARLMGSHQTFTARYESECRSEAISLRNEIEQRLGTLHIDRPKPALSSLYERPTNPIGLNQVAVDLERIARSLP